MDQTLSCTQHSWARWLAAAAALMLLAACEAPQRSADYRQQWQVAVGKETISLVVAMPAAGDTLAGLEAATFERFVRRYVEAGQGGMTVEASGAAADRARDMLLKEGVRDREIIVAPAAGGVANAAVLTYTAATIAVPDCGDWSSNATFNWSNRVHSNFGCVTQRNIGLTVRNPADLETPRTVSPGDGTHAAGVIDNYRKAPGLTGAGGTKQKSAATGE